MIKIPEWSNAVEAVENGTASPLDLFVYHNEPAGNPQDIEFRNQLQALLEYVSGLTPRAVDLACSCGGKSLMRVLLCDDCGSIIMPPSH